MRYEAVKALVQLPGWAEALNNADKLTTEASSYIRVPLIYRATNIRAAALTAVPFVLTKGKNEVPWESVFATPLKQLLTQTERSLLLSGQAYWLKQVVGSRLVGAQWLNPFTMKTEVKVSKSNNGVQVDMMYTQSVGNETFGPWSQDQVVHFKEFHPQSDLTDGVSAAQVALGASKQMSAIVQFAAAFFEGGAMPVTLLGFEGNPQPDEISRIEAYFRRMAMGVRNAFAVLGLMRKVTAQVLTPPMNTLAMPELRQQAMEDISWAFGIPQAMLTDAANYATAAEHRRSFYEETVNPQADYIADVITSQFLAGTKFRLEARPQQMDIFQEDEASRATSLQTLTNAGIPLLVAMDMLGFEITDEQRALIIEAEQNKPAPAATETQPAAEAQPIVGSDDQAKADLQRWQRKALNALKSGKSPAVEFDSEYIDASEAARISAALAEAKTVGDVKKIFSPAKSGLDAELKRANDILEALLS